jgi:hypothetical protein
LVSPLERIFMTIILSVLLVIAIGIIIQQRRYRNRITKTSTRLIGNLHYEKNRLLNEFSQLLSEYEALEMGQEELIDNYENDFLDLQAKVTAAQNSAEYDREMREEAEKKLKMTNDLIDAHAGSCETILKEYVNVMMEEINPKDE